MALFLFIWLALTWSNLEERECGWEVQLKNLSWGFRDGSADKVLAGQASTGSYTSLQKGSRDATDSINIRNGLEVSDFWSRWSESTSLPKILINHTLGQNLSFVATSAVNNFERAKISSDSLTSSHGGTGSHLWVPTGHQFISGWERLHLASSRQQRPECIPTCHRSFPRVLAFSPVLSPVDLQSL